MTVQEQGWVRFAEGKAKVTKKWSKLIKPLSRQLLETVEGFMQLVDVVGVLIVNEARRLLHVDFFMEVFMKECI